ncbi:MAG: hypothetical protein ABIO45_12725 [Burkholderiaceae bacterium]
MTTTTHLPARSAFVGARGSVVASGPAVVAPVACRLASTAG